MRRLAIFVLSFFCLALPAVSLSALEGMFQINSVFQTNTYPLFGDGGKHTIRFSSAGIALKSTRGAGFQGVLDIALLFPYKIEEKVFPARTFSTYSETATPLAMDGLVGLGYGLDVPPMFFLFSGGFHSGVLLDGANTLVSFGVGLDAQTQVRFGKNLTAQIGLKTALDFGGTQSFSTGSDQFSGLPLSFGFYTGMGVSY